MAAAPNSPRHPEERQREKEEELEQERGSPGPRALQPGRSCRWRRAAKPRSHPLSAAQQPERAAFHLGGVFFSLSVTAGLLRYPWEMAAFLHRPRRQTALPAFLCTPPGRAPSARPAPGSTQPRAAPHGRPQPRSGPGRSAAQPSRRADANPCRALTSAPAPPSSVTARAVGDALR